MTKLRVLDLFSGIGGFSLGLERTGGFETVAFCEIEPYPRAVLARHWPGVPCYEDVRTLTADTLRRDGIAVDVICGGFPCHDVSFAGKRAGLEGERSGLWREYARLIGELRPRFVLVENVPGLLNLGMGTVLGDLAALGYDATWDCIPAVAVGAPHRRDRVWIIAHTDSPAIRKQPVAKPRSDGPTVARRHSEAADAYGERKHAFTVHAEVEGTQEPVAYSDDTGSQGRHSIHVRQRPGEWTARPSSPSVANSNISDEHGRGGHVQVGRKWSSGETPQDGFTGRTQWLSEPDVGRVAHGVSSRVDHLRGLGNAVVPQIPEIIGRAILKAEGLAA